MVDVLFGLLVIAIFLLLLFYLGGKEKSDYAKMVAYDNSPEANQKRLDEFHFQKIFYEYGKQYGFDMQIDFENIYNESRQIFLKKYSREYNGPFEYNKSDEDYFCNKGPMRIPLKIVKKNLPSNDDYIYHATMTPKEFIAAGYTDDNGVTVLINPKDNKHPMGYFLSWKDKEGIASSGHVSNNITSPEEFTAPVLSVVSTNDQPDNFFVLLHNNAGSPTNQFVKLDIPKNDELISYATMSYEQFVDKGYCAKGTFGVSINPNGNNHPKGFYIHWKDKEGVSYSGEVSTKILCVEDITDPVISIVSTVDKVDFLVLFHNKHDAPTSNIVINFK